MSSMFEAGVRLRRVGAPLALAVRRLACRDTIFVSSSASFGSAGVAITSDELQQVELAALVGRHLDLVEPRRLLREPRDGVDAAAWFARASSASVSSVMKFCATQPACAAAMPSFSSVPFAFSRNGLPRPAVAAAVGAPGPSRPTERATRTGTRSTQPRRPTSTRKAKEPSCQ